MLIFGGYDGHQRLNDLHSYNFTTHKWTLLNNVNAPSPRDRHSAVIYENSFVIFGGFDGVTRVDDLHVYDLETNTWSSVDSYTGVPPSARHSHSAVRWRDCLYIFGGYDGSYRSDFHEFNFKQSKWTQVAAAGEVPRARYRGTCVVFENIMILHGGHDGSRHLQGVFHKIVTRLFKSYN
jgi:N-acetylneuraminic acid mutarotase